MSRGHSCSYPQHSTNIVEDEQDNAVAVLASPTAELQDSLDELSILKASQSKSQNEKTKLEAMRKRQHPLHIATAIRELVLDHDPRIEWTKST